MHQPTPVAVEITSDNPSKPPLGFGLSAFLVFQALRVLFNLSALTSVFVAGRLSRLADMAAPTGFDTQENIMAEFYAEAVIIGIDVVATVFGLSLVVRRHQHMRRFWLVFLAIHCVMQLDQLDAAVSFLMGFAWLVYWIVAKRPRELQLSTFWQRP